MSDTSMPGQGSSEALLRIEASMGSRVKYRFDDVGRLVFERALLHTGAFPANYGHLLDTRAEDGRELDGVLVLHEPLVPGSLIRVRVLDALALEDRHGLDHKVLCAPVSPESGSSPVESAPYLEELRMFFAVYKPDHEAVEPIHWVGYANAQRVFAQALERFQDLVAP